MKEKVFLGLQLLAGLMLVVFGLNKFLHFITHPPMPVSMGLYMGALAKSGFIFPIVAVVEIIAGLAFLTNKYVSLMAVVLMPVMVNAFLAHLFLDPAGIGGSAFLMIVLIVIMIRNKDRYTQILKA